MAQVPALSSVVPEACDVEVIDISLSLKGVGLPDAFHAKTDCSPNPFPADRRRRASDRKMPRRHGVGGGYLPLAGEHRRLRRGCYSLAASSVPCRIARLASSSVASAAPPMMCG